MRRYLAYGSNLCERQMAILCPAARQAETVILPNWRFIINSLGVATILPDPAARVLGLVWHLTPECEAALDIYECIDVGRYRRAELTAEDAAALVYLAADTSPGEPQVGYLELILHAAEALGFDPAYRAELAGWTRRVA